MSGERKQGDDAQWNGHGSSDADRRWERPEETGAGEAETDKAGTNLEPGRTGAEPSDEAVSDTGRSYGGPQGDAQVEEAAYVGYGEGGGYGDGDDDGDEEDEESLGVRIWRKIRNVLVTLLVIGLFVAGTAFGVGAYVVNSLQPTEPGEEVRFVIERGSHSSRIAEDLEAQGLIRDAKVFRLYLRYKGEGTRFQAGEYLLRPGMELDEMIEKFNNGDIFREPVRRLTIPEGRTLEQITDMLSQSGIIDRTVFRRLLADPSLYDGTLAAQIPPDRAYKQPLEGYIFPITYEFPVSWTSEQIVVHMLEELERQLDNLPADWREQLDKLNLSFHDVLTVASLIEREVVVDEERPIVAGVIYNRLKNNYPLQIDATVQYALDQPKERLLHEDLEVDSPYNTYKHVGLPPGPIASPGLASIEAALYPADTTYMFYVTKKDGSSEHYFAETYEEHLANIALSERNAASAAAE
jgi:UPF0755 protein